MKNILLATDFSLNAHRAAICAGEITNRLGGRLIILHALAPLKAEKEKENFHREAQWEENDPGAELSEENAQRRLDDLAKELHNRFNISVSRLVKPGHAEEEISAIGKNLRVRIAVVGAQGENLQPNKILGSVANGLLFKSTIPLVCVPQEELLPFSHQMAIILSKQQHFCNKIGLGFLAELNSQLNHSPGTSSRQKKRVS